MRKEYLPSVELIISGVTIAMIWLFVGGFFATIGAVGCWGLSGHPVINNCSLPYEILITIIGAPIAIRSLLVPPTGTYYDGLLDVLSALFLTFVLLYLTSYVVEKFRKNKTRNI